MYLKKIVGGQKEVKIFVDLLIQPFIFKGVVALPHFLFRIWQTLVVIVSKYVHLDYILNIQVNAAPK